MPGGRNLPANTARDEGPVVLAALNGPLKMQSIILLCQPFSKWIASIYIESKHVKGKKKKAKHFGGKRSDTV